MTPCDNDLALARAIDPTTISSWQGDNVDGYDTPAGAAALVSGMKVRKFGRTTGHSWGRLQSKVTVPTPNLLQCQTL